MTEPGAGRRFATPPYCRTDDRICRNRRPFATAAGRGAFTRSLVGAAKRGRTLRTPCHAADRVTAAGTARNVGDARVAGRQPRNCAAEDGG
jgi:hypothetical protein